MLLHEGMADGTKNGVVCCVTTKAMIVGCFEQARPDFIVDFSIFLLVSFLVAAPAREANDVGT